ncbi:MAG TPA: DUF4097 family beta strand repeat-containing protein [Deinococcales bacterium]|nr:DUF4097 family beta strand repeat-containing protein [Deinococcales bacterium]
MNELERERKVGATPANRTVLAVALIAVGAAGILLGGRDNGGGIEIGFPIHFGQALTESTETRSVDFAGVRDLEVRTFNGRVELSTTSGEGVVELGKRGDVVITSEKQGSRYVVTARSRNVTCFNCGVNIKLQVPEGLAVDLASSNGSINLTGKVAGARLASSNGSIEVVNAGSANVNAATSNGRVEVRSLQGEVRVSSSNGRITLEDVTFPAGTRNEARTSNGGIEVKGVSAPDGLAISGSTSNGNVKVDLPGFQVQVDRRSFEARKDGGNKAELRLESSNASLTVTD